MPNKTILFFNQKKNQEIMATSMFKLGSFCCIVLFLVTTIWWACRLDKIDPSVKYDPCIGKVTSKFTHDKIGVTCDSPCTVRFTNSSIGAKSYRWDFGEGGTSIETNPTYIFKKAGKWDVKLTAFSDNNSCSHVSTESVTINTPVADLPMPDFTFTFSNNNQFASATVNFKNNSQNAVSYKWTFDDNNASSTDASPSYTYNIAKGYNVTLEATNNAGLKATKTLPVTINARKFAVAMGSTSFDNGRSVQQTRDGGYITCGYTISEGQGGYDFYMIKTDATGKVLTKKPFGGQLEERGYAIQQTTLGGYVMAGYTDEGKNGSRDVYLVITDITGNTAISQLKFGGSKSDESFDIGLTQDGGYIICGYTESMGAGNKDVYLIKTDANGTLRWEKTYGKGNNDVGTSVQQTTDGGFIICGSTGIGTSTVSNDNVFLIKTKTNGDTLWTKNYGGEGNDYGSSVQQTKDGGYIICGGTYSKGYGSLDIYLIKTKADGTFLWDKTFGGANIDSGSSVQQTSDGGYIICGGTYSLGSGALDVYLVKTDSSGELQWQKTFGGTNFDDGFSVQQTSDGGYIICGYTYSSGAGQSDFYLIKTDKDGNHQ